MRWIKISCVAASSVFYAWSAGAAPTQSFEQFRASSLKIPLKQIPWKDPRALTLVDDFLSSYARLYTEFPKAFAPYDDTQMSQKDLWEHLCAERLKFLCKDDAFRRKAENVFNLDKFEQIYKRASEGEEYSTSHQRFFFAWEKLNSLSRHLKDAYSKFDAIYLHELQNLVANSANLESLDALNTALEKVRSTTQEAADHYTNEYTQRTVSYPERLLLNKYFVDLIEGQFFDVEKIDMIQAIKNISKSLQEQFAYDLVSILASYSDDKRPEYTRGWNATLNILQEREVSSKPYTFWSESHLSYYPTLTSASHINIPTISNSNVLRLIREFHNNDARTVDFLLHNSYQRAAWQLRDSNRADLADKLEKIIETELWSPDRLVSIKNLGGGFGTTMVTAFEDRLRCVYKPDEFNPVHPLDKITGDADFEVAASVLDRLLDLRMVPLTVKATFADHKEGSCQYFAENSIRARDMLLYNTKKPGKFDIPTGRGKKTGDVLFFDWLIANWDRNVDNYIYQNDGRVVLIDHGYSFKVHPPVTWKRLKKMLPSKRVYDRIVELEKNPEILQNTLKPYLSSTRIWYIKEKIKHTVKLVNKHKAYQEVSCGHE